jgi:hypothetical protein
MKRASCLQRATGPEKAARRLFLCLGVLVAGSCGVSDEVAAVCSRASDFESSMVAVDQSIDDLSSIAPRQIQSSFAVFLGSLLTLNEIAPYEVRDDFVRVSRFYTELSIALQNVYWDGNIGATDTAVQRSIANMTRSDNIQSLGNVRDFIREKCSVELTTNINNAPGDLPEMPEGSLIVEPQPDSNTGFDNEATALRSYGYFVAEQFGIVLTQSQAECVGIAFTEDAEEVIDETNEQYKSRLRGIFVSCEIAALIP